MFKGTCSNSTSWFRTHVPGPCAQSDDSTSYVCSLSPAWGAVLLFGLPDISQIIYSSALDWSWQDQTTSLSLNAHLSILSTGSFTWAGHFHFQTHGRHSALHKVLWVFIDPGVTTTPQAPTSKPIRISRSLSLSLSAPPWCLEIHLSHDWISLIFEMPSKPQYCQKLLLVSIPPYPDS